MLAIVATSFAADALASFDCFALALKRRLLVKAATLYLLQDAFFRHFLLEDFHSLFEAIANLNLDGFTKVVHRQTVYPKVGPEIKITWSSEARSFEIPAWLEQAIPLSFIRKLFLDDAA